MSWDWVGSYPVFVYTTFIDHFEFKVKVVLGTKGNQNAGGTGPSAPAWMEYIQKGVASKDEVVQLALFKAQERLLEEGLITKEEIFSYEDCD